MTTTSRSGARRLNPVQRAVRALDPPTQAELARLTKKHPQEITRWVRRGVVPGEVALVVEAASGISRHQLCPKVFGEAPKLNGAAT